MVGKGETPGLKQASEKFFRTKTRGRQQRHVVRGGRTRLTLFLDKPSPEEDHRDLGRKKRVSSLN
jgi:hypothetical protein